MFLKSITVAFIATVAFFNFLSADMTYEIQDIGTLQTRSSRAIAINNVGQILGEYNIDRTANGRHVFLRDRDGSFHEIVENPSIVYEDVPEKFHSIRIDWRYLTDDGIAYGVFTYPDNATELKNANPILFMWDRQNGIFKLCQLPGKGIVKINNFGQVLLQTVFIYDKNGTPSKHPAIWENGKLTILYGLEGDLGIPSEESQVFDMNNKGEVVGQSP